MCVQRQFLLRLIPRASHDVDNDFYIIDIIIIIVMIQYHYWFVLIWNFQEEREYANVRYGDTILA
jgi:hypothetical protein